MTSRRIAITMRVSASEHQELHDSISQGWDKFLAAALPEACWLPVPNLGEKATTVLENFGVDALILSGGENWGAHPKRDSTEAALFQWALEQNIPIIGVCRGAQIINTLLGGTLTPTDGDGHVAVRHQLNLDGSAISVNSYHRLVITEADLSPSLVQLTTADDRTVEAFIAPERNVVGILWHPERETVPQLHDMAIFRRIFQQDLA